MKKMVALLLALLFLLMSACQEAAPEEENSAPEPDILTPEESPAQAIWEDYAANAALTLLQLRSSGFDSTGELIPYHMGQFVANVLIGRNEYTDYLVDEVENPITAEELSGPEIYLSVPEDVLRPLLLQYFGESGAAAYLSQGIPVSGSFLLQGSSLFLEENRGTAGGLGSYTGQAVNSLSLASVDEREDGGLICEFHSTGALHPGEDDSRISGLHKLLLLPNDGEGGYRIDSAAIEYIPPGEIAVSSGFHAFTQVGDYPADQVEKYALFQDVVGESMMCLYVDYDNNHIPRGQTLFTIDPQTGSVQDELTVEAGSGFINFLVQSFEDRLVFLAEDTLLVYGEALTLEESIPLPGEYLSGPIRLTGDYSRLYFCAEDTIISYNLATGESVTLTDEDSTVSYYALELWEEGGLLMAEYFDESAGETAVRLIDRSTGETVTDRSGISLTDRTAPLFTENTLIFPWYAGGSDGDIGEDAGNIRQMEGGAYLYDTEEDSWSTVSYGLFPFNAEIHHSGQYSYYSRQETEDGINTYTLVRQNLVDGQVTDLGCSVTVAQPYVYGALDGGETLVIGVYYPGYSALGSVY